MKDRDGQLEKARRLHELEEQLIAYVGRGTGRLEHHFSEEWDVDRRVVRNYINEVRARWAAEAPEGREERRANMRRTLEELAYSARARGRDNVALRAYDLLISLDGLNAPLKIEATGANGGAIQAEIKLTIEQARMLASDDDVVIALEPASPLALKEPQ